jgi:hypothetical protein
VLINFVNYNLNTCKPYVIISTVHRRTLKGFENRHGIAFRCVLHDNAIDAQRLSQADKMHEGTRWCIWSWHIATNRKVADSIADGVIAIFNRLNCSALGSTPLLTEMCTRNMSWEVKAAGAYGWQPCHFHVPTVWKFWEPQPPAAVRECPDL